MATLTEILVITAVDNTELAQVQANLNAQGLTVVAPTVPNMTRVDDVPNKKVTITSTGLPNRTNW